MFGRMGLGLGLGSGQMVDGDNAMILEVAPNGLNLSVTLPIVANSTYFPPGYTEGISIDWGDGTVTAMTNETAGAPNSHLYVAGTYQIRITGKLKKFGIGATWGASAGAALLTAVVSFGNLGITSFSGAFHTCTGLISVPAALPTGVTDTGYMFMNCSNNSFNPNVATWDMSAVTLSYYMFIGCTGTSFNPDVSNWDVGNVTRADYMFSDCNKNAFNPNVSAWNVGNVTNFNSMFSGCYGTSFNPDVSNWDVSKGTDLGRLFRSCNKAAFRGGRGATGVGIASRETPSRWLLRAAGVAMTDFFVGAYIQDAEYIDAILIAWAALHTGGKLPLNVTMTFGANQPRTNSAPITAALTLLTNATGDGGAGWTISALIAV